MAVLTRKIGPLPTWAYIAIVVIGGVAFYIWWRHYTNTNAASQAQSTSGVAGANPAYDPLNPTNDPNIDPNTGVPYQLEEATNPATGAPYYYSSASSPSTTPTSTTPTSTTPTSTTPTSTTPTSTTAPVSSTIGGVSDTSGNVSYAGNTNAQFNATGGSVASGGKPYTFGIVGNTGQTNHLWNVAIQEYGVSGTSAVNAATQQIINANPSLAGKSYTYQPPVGTKITIPQL